MIQKTDSVTVKFGEEPNVKEFSQAYTYDVFENADDILNALQNKEKTIEVLQRLNAAMKTNAQVTARNSIMSDQAAPERAFEAQVKSFMKSRLLAGKPVAEDKARAFIKAQMEAVLD